MKSSLSDDQVELTSERLNVWLLCILSLQELMACRWGGTSQYVQMTKPLAPFFLWGLRGLPLLPFEDEAIGHLLPLMASDTQIKLPQTPLS